MKEEDDIEIMVRVAFAMALLLFMLLTAPFLVSADRDIDVWLGGVEIVGAVVWAALIIGTHIHDQFFKRVVNTFTKGTK